MSDTVTMTLTEFLLARIAEDEADYSDLLRSAQNHALAVKDPILLGRAVPGWFDWPKVEEAASRALAEVGAKRQIVRHAAQTTALSGATDYTQGSHQAAQFALRVLATVYADHPDYREEWRP